MKFSLAGHRAIYMAAFLFTVIGVGFLVSLPTMNEKPYYEMVGYAFLSTLFAIFSLPLAWYSIKKTFLVFGSKGVYYSSIIREKQVPWENITGLTISTNSKSGKSSYYLAINSGDKAGRPPIFAFGGIPLSAFEKAFSSAEWYTGKVGQALRMYAPADVMARIDADAKKHGLS